MVVCLADDITDLLSAYVHIALAQNLCQLGCLDESCPIGIDLLEEGSQLLNFLLVRCLHQQVHRGLLES